MFNFTTTTFINDVSRVLKKGDELNYKDSEEQTAKVPDGQLWVKSNHLVFKKDTLLKEDGTKVTVYKKAGCTGKPDKATLTLPNDSNLHRLVLRVRPSMSDQDSYLSNSLVFKGKPFYVEFRGNDNVADLIKKYELLMVETPLILAEQTGKVLTLTTARPSLRLEVVEVQDLVKAEDTDAEYILPGQVKVWVSSNIVVTTEVGHEDFGTYSQLTKDIVLPTWEHRRWATNQADEQPIPGALYSQYILRMCVNRGVMGGDAVGEVTKSLTSHVFWVKEDQITAWEAALVASFGELDLQVQDAHDEETVEVAGKTVNKKSRAEAHTQTATDKNLSE